MSASKPLGTRRKAMDDIKTRLAPLAWDEHGGELLTGHVVSGVEVA